MTLFNFSTDVAIDLGTANTLIYVRGQGVVLNEPSIVAVDRATRKMIAVGTEALQMHERTHMGIETIRPLQDGVIADFEVAEQLIRGLIAKLKKGWFTSIRQMVICIPSGITPVEKRAVHDSAEHAGAKKVYLIAEPMAAAIGVGLDIEKPQGNMVVDIGGGTTEIAVIALSGICVDESIRVAGNELDTAILSYFKRYHNLMIGQRTAERIKHEVGSAVARDPELEAQVRGRDMSTGIPQIRTISSEDVRTAIREVVDQITTAVWRCLEHTPPELGSDILESGIMLTGGGAHLHGMDEVIKSRVNINVHKVDTPLEAVVRGTGIVLENISKYSNIFM